jgi:hypothetical protein
VTTAAQITHAYPRAASVAKDVVALGRELGVDPAWIANVIQFESGWNPQAVNSKSGASGLIQFMPKTASGLGTSVSVIRTMNAKQQWPYVRRYFLPYRRRLSSQVDVFMAVFYPSAIGKGENYRFSARVTKYNPGIFTSGDYVRKALRRARLSPSSPSPSTQPSPVGRRSGGGLAQLRRKRERQMKILFGTGAALFTLIALVAVVARQRMG